MSARPRAGSLCLMKSGCLYETLFLSLGSFGAPCASSSSDATGMPWEFMEINKNLWEFCDHLLEGEIDNRQIALEFGEITSQIAIAFIPTTIY
jgi:hypothetical protein